MTVDGTEREICCFGIFGLREWGKNDIEEIQWLLGVGAQFLETEGGSKP